MIAIFFKTLIASRHLKWSIKSRFLTGHCPINAFGCILRGLWQVHRKLHHWCWQQHNAWLLHKYFFHSDWIQSPKHVEGEFGSSSSIKAENCVLHYFLILSGLWWPREKKGPCQSPGPRCLPQQELGWFNQKCSPQCCPTRPYRGMHFLKLFIEHNMSPKNRLLKSMKCALMQSNNPKCVGDTNDVRIMRQWECLQTDVLQAHE